MAYTNIDKPEDYFNTLIWTGDGSRPANITGVGFQPDFVWAKSRSNAYHHNLYDSSRGAGAEKELVTNSTQAEGGTNNDEYGYLTSFNSDGFSSTDTNFNAYFNQNSVTYVAWNWKANGGTTSTDTTSSITSTVQVNSDAGFSVVTYTGDGTTTGGFGHGLGVAPKVVFVKRRNAAANWCVYHESIGAGFYLQLDTTAAQQSGPWQSLAPNSTTVIVYGGGLVNGNGDTYVAYCFAEKQGYSKFGRYVGNGSTNGAFVYTGFKPAFVIIKRTDAAEAWVTLDTARNPFNGMDARLFPNQNTAESTSQVIIDSLSNGFKLRTADSAYNGNAASYIYMAFAENPFVTSTGIPTTAR